MSTLSSREDGFELLCSLGTKVCSYFMVLAISTYTGFFPKILIISEQNFLRYFYIYLIYNNRYQL